MEPTPFEVQTRAAQPVERIALARLDFDLRNPRYGTAASKINTQRDALNHIVKMFGVNDVLSSISVNGFFDSEPLVGIEEPGTNRITVYEGNRRLAACLILAGDDRAQDQKRLQDQYRGSYEGHGTKRIDPVPVIIYRGDKALNNILPYIGVRHIVGFLEWDSYAKAAWINKVVTQHGLSLSDVQEMVGDKNDTIPKMLSGYRFVNQLVNTGHFNPEQSQRKGRGSNPYYPFSWVYTALLNNPIKRFLDLVERDGVAVENPIPEAKLEDAGQLLTFMFGDRTRGIAAVIDDSRELGDLSKAVNDPVLRNRLKDGRKLDVVMREARPSIERLQEGLQQATDLLEDMVGLIGRGNLDSEAAEKLVPSAKSVFNLSKNVLHELRKIQINDDGDGEE
jgi:hypothetical protein